MSDLVAQDSSKAIVSCCDGKNASEDEDFATWKNEGIGFCELVVN